MDESLCTDWLVKDSTSMLHGLDPIGQVHEELVSGELTPVDVRSAGLFL